MTAVSPTYGSRIETDLDGNVYVQLTNTGQGAQFGNFSIPSGDNACIFSLDSAGNGRWLTCWPESWEINSQSLRPEDAHSNFAIDASNQKGHVISFVQLSSGNYLYSWITISLEDGKYTVRNTFSTPSGCVVVVRYIYVHQESLYHIGYYSSSCGAPLYFGANLPGYSTTFIAKISLISDKFEWIRAFSGIEDPTYIAKLAFIEFSCIQPGCYLLIDLANYGTVTDDRRYSYEGIPLAITKSHFVLKIDSASGNYTSHITWTSFQVGYMVVTPFEIVISGSVGQLDPYGLIIGSQKYYAKKATGIGLLGLYVISLDLFSLDLRKILLDDKSDNIYAFQLLWDPMYNNTYLIASFIGSLYVGSQKYTAPLQGEYAVIIKIGPELSNPSIWKIASTSLSPPDGYSYNGVPFKITLDRAFPVLYGLVASKNTITSIEDFVIPPVSVSLVRIVEGCYMYSFSSLMACNSHGECKSPNNCECKSVWNGTDCATFPSSGKKLFGYPTPPDCFYVDPFGTCSSSGDEFTNGMLIDGNFAIAFGQPLRYKSKNNWPYTFTFFSKGLYGFTTVCFSNNQSNFDQGYCFIANFTDQKFIYNIDSKLSELDTVQTRRYSNLFDLTESHNLDNIMLPNTILGQIVLPKNNTSLTPTFPYYNVRRASSGSFVLAADQYPNMVRFQITLDLKLRKMVGPSPYIFMGTSRYSSLGIPITYSETKVFQINLTDHYSPFIQTRTNWNFRFHRIEALDIISWSVCHLVYLVFLFLTILFSSRPPMVTRGIFPMISILMHWMNHLSSMNLFFGFDATRESQIYFVPMRYASIITLIIGSTLMLWRFLILEFIHKQQIRKRGSSMTTRMSMFRGLLNRWTFCLVIGALFFLLYGSILAIGFIPMFSDYDMDFILNWVIFGLFTVKLAVYVIWASFDLLLDSIVIKKCEFLTLVFIKDFFWFRFQFYIVENMISVCGAIFFAIMNYYALPYLYTCIMILLLAQDAGFVLFVTIVRALIQLFGKKAKSNVIQDFLQVKSCHDHFLEYARSEWAAENILFFDDVQRYNRAQDPQTRYDIAKNIIEIYLSKSKSPMELNVSQKSITIVMEKFSKMSSLIVSPDDLFKSPFDEAIQNISDTYSRFISTSVYQELMVSRAIELRFFGEIITKNEGADVVSRQTSGSDINTILNSKIQKLEEELSNMNKQRSTEIDHLQKELHNLKDLHMDTIKYTSKEQPMEQGSDGAIENTIEIEI